MTALRWLRRRLSPWRTVCNWCDRRAEWSRCRWAYNKPCPHGWGLIYGTDGLTRRELAPWVRSLWAWVSSPWWLLFAALMWLLLASRAEAQEWRGSMQWRGERVELVSCCGPMREPVIRRELDACLDVVRADLGLDVAIPKLGAPGAPYTIEVVRDPVVCQKSELCPAGADCSGCSVTVHDRYLWTKVVMRDKVRKRAAPVKHECRHRLCVAGLRAAVVPIRTMADLLAIVPACQLADHGAGKGYRWDVAGRRVEVRR